MQGWSLKIVNFLKTGKDGIEGMKGVICTQYIWILDIWELGVYFK